MYIFGTVGIPVMALFLSFFHPHMAQMQNMQRREPHFARVMIKPSPMTPTDTPLSSVEVPITIASMGSGSPTPTPASTTQPTPLPNVSAATDTVQAYIMTQINNYRTSLGLSPVQTNDLTCNFSKVRAQEIATNFSHDGFNQRIQNHTLPYPSYSLVTENIAETSNYQEVVTMWENSAPHAENMRANTPYICVEQYNNYYAFEGWKPL